MILVDVLIVVLLAYAVYLGSRRGPILLALELLSMTMATAAAITIYRPFGHLLKSIAGISAGLGNVAAFLIIWMGVEILSALLIRLYILPRLRHRPSLSLANRVGGAVLSGVKFLLILSIALVVGVGLPLNATIKQPLTSAYLPKVILASTQSFQSWLSSGLGRDLTDSLTFFTITSDAESEKRIELGFTTTGSIDAPDEDKMLELLNRERTTRGLIALKLNTSARTVARSYSRELFERGFFSHISDGKTPFDRLRAGGVTFGTAGENLALAPTLDQAHQGLMNSAGHRANILSKNYKTVGIGIIDGGQYGLMVTQDFTD